MVAAIAARFAGEPVGSREERHERGIVGGTRREPNHFGEYAMREKNFRGVSRGAWSRAGRHVNPFLRIVWRRAANFARQVGVVA